ncbi:hypothetical protein L1987_58324 [Smallanthus sonchifolius]|uniref:Uncharacterized protein n=1 Tax=Smallanthus sonchifolius TaxID=185202 RepID=A0ACB9DFE7_9ASTR|nr:hypothetical protein L1987_58324 [Smallanthus sonchifolius]
MLIPGGVLPCDGPFVTSKHAGGDEAKAGGSRLRPSFQDVAFTGKTVEVDADTACVKHSDKSQRQVQMSDPLNENPDNTSLSSTSDQVANNTQLEASVNQLKVVVHGAEEARDKAVVENVVVIAVRDEAVKSVN